MTLTEWCRGLDYRSSIKWTKGKLLGVGSFGNVYQGRDIDSKKVYAVKEMRFTNQVRVRIRVRVTVGHI